MSDHPIIFSAPMVRALLDGRKTMTRRLAWRERRRLIETETQRYNEVTRVPSPWQKVKPGDRLWVKENHYLTDDGDYEQAVYAADHGAAAKHLSAIDALGSSDVAARHRKLRPSIHMPRWASRLTLIVTAAKIERLQNISAEDSQAEGIWREDLPVAPIFHSGAVDREGEITALSAKTCFQRLWLSLHGLESWDANPEVVALTFTVHTVNIDALEKAA